MPDRPVVRWSVRVAAIAAATLALYRYGWLPYRANHVLFAVERRTASAETQPPYKGLPIARDNLVLLESVAPGCRTDVNYHMLHAANDRLLRHWDDAERHYNLALTLDHRPEIYFYRGMTKLGRGDVDAAVADLVIAARFNESTTDDLEGNLRDRVRRQAGLVQ
jgi:hypothetical protein